MTEEPESPKLKIAERKVLSDLFPEVSNLPELSDYAWRKHTFDGGEVLFRPGQPCTRFLLLGHGSVRVELQNDQGRSLILYRIEPGQLCIHSLINLLTDDSYHFLIVAESPGWFCWAEKSQFNRWMEQSTEFQKWILNNIGTRMRQVIDRFAQHAFLPVESRLAALLIERMGTDQVIELKQSELAAELGTAREIVSRQLSSWQKKNLLETKRGRVVIKDLDGVLKIVK